MWIHLHIPKNAGTTFRDILDRSFGDAHLSIYDRYNPKQEGRYRGHFDHEEFAQHLVQAPAGTEVISGHHILMPDHQITVEFDLRYLTWIRNPIDRVVSLYHYERKFAQRMPSVYGTKHLALGPFEDYVVKRLQQDDHLSDWQCLDLCGTRDSNAAKVILDRCEVVGLVDKFDDSLLLFQQAMGRRLKTWYEQKNRAEKPMVAPCELPIEILRLLKSVNQNDLELYEYAKARMRTDLSHLSGLGLKRSTFKLRNKFYRTAVGAQQRLRTAKSRLRKALSF